jgi:uncharacterized protein (DUF362 family)
MTRIFGEPNHEYARRVRLATGVAGYPQGAPFGPDEDYPELAGVPWARRVAGPNAVYGAVRRMLAGMNLDAGRFGTPAWNPLADLAPRGGRVTIKPNMVRHWNGSASGTWRSVVVHWSVVRPLIDYALLAVGPGGRVSVGDAPHWDCDMSQLEQLLDLPAFREHYAKTAPGQVALVDFRPEWFDVAGPVKGEPIPLSGDPQGYVLADLAAHSMFHDPNLNPSLFYGSGYDNRTTIRSHTEGRHEYLVAGSALKCDLFINVPKLKTHHLLGITVAMKNLVGINGDKNCLPHFRLGFVADGGDQYPRRSLSLVTRLAILRRVMPLLARRPALRRAWGRALGAFHKAGGKNPYAGGSWIGNDTVWRMALDLNRILLYAREDGTIVPGVPARRYLTVVDGVIAGEGEGPMEPLDRATGVLLAAGHPLACDLVAARIMGFDTSLLRLCTEGMMDHPLSLRPARRPEDLDLAVLDVQGASEWNSVLWGELPNMGFTPPIGWREAVRRAS